MHKVIDDKLTHEKYAPTHQVLSYYVIYISVPVVFHTSCGTVLFQYYYSADVDHVL